jgi:hypothetical protein
MRSALLTIGVVSAILSSAMTAGAQVRGRLTTRPPIPSAVRPPTTVRPFPLWWGVIAVPEVITLDQPALGADAPTGGVQLDIQPWSAEVYVDGAAIGRVEQFRGYYQHLTLPAGPHIIAVVAPGREPLIVGVTVIPGRVVTQRGSLGIAGSSTLP